MTFEQTKEQFLLAYNSNAYLNMCESDDMHNVIVALEKPIPKKPIKEKNYSHGRYTVAKCPTCDGLLGLYSFAETSFKCCCECGQALDWSDT